MLCKGFRNLSMEFNGNEIKSALENSGVFVNLLNGRDIPDQGSKFTTFSTVKRDQENKRELGRVDSCNSCQNEHSVKKFSFLQTLFTFLLSKVDKDLTFCSVGGDSSVPRQFLIYLCLLRNVHSLVIKG